MPQEFHVLRCYSCETFQVHIVKKSNKWACKMCGEKQSVKKVYGKGSGKECRVHVQSLNATRFVDECVEQEMPLSDDDTGNRNEDSQSCNLSSNYSSEGSSRKSKWDEYVTEENAAVSDVSDEDSKYTFERQKKRSFSQKKSVVESGRENKRFKQ